MLLVNGCKSWDEDWVNDYAVIRRTAEAKEIIPKKSAELYLSLVERNIVPLWVQQMTDHKMMRYAAM